VAELTVILLALGILLVIVTVVGHGIWVAFSKLFSSAAKPAASRAGNRSGERRALRRACPRCFFSLEAGQQACALCGWSELNIATSDVPPPLTALRTMISEFALRGEIDAETRKRLLAAIQTEEQRLAQQHATAPAPASAMASTATPGAAGLASAGTEEVVDVLLEPIEPASGMAAASEPAAPSHLPIGERARRYAASREEAARDESTETDGQPTQPPRRREALSRPLGAFMEEKNIRWGELVGGLLIVGCSIALVISFWSEIATRPLLKFGLFNGVIAALFGVGIYTDRRWKIHTTSHGVLVIATLLVPLNFLAIAAFTQSSPPTDLWSFAGEALSLLIFAALVYFGGRIIVPQDATLLVVAVLLPSLLQLVIRRFVGPGMPLAVLYGFAAAPVATYLGATLRVVWRRWTESSRFTPSLAATHAGHTAGGSLSAPMLAEDEASRVLVFFGLASAAAVVPLTLLLFNVPPANVTLHWLAPLLTVVALPALLVGLLFARNRGCSRGAAHAPPALHAGDELTLRSGAPYPSVALQTAGIAVGVAGAMLMVVAVMFAWPDPATLLPTAVVSALLLWGVAIWFQIPAAHLSAGLALAAAWPICFYLLRGDVGWTIGPATRMEHVLLSVTTGQVLVPLLMLFACIALWLRRLNRADAAFMYGILAAITLAVSLMLVMWYGFARVGDPQNVTWTLALYALTALVAAILLNRSEAAFVGAVLLLAALVQAIVYRYGLRATPVQPANTWITALLTHATSLAIVAMAAGWRSRRPAAIQSLLVSAQVTALAAAALAVLNAANSTAAPLSVNFGWLAGVWMLLATITGSASLFTASQIALLVAIFCGVTAAVETRAWYVESRRPWLDPWFLQAQGIALAGYCLFVGALREFVLRSARRRAQYVLEPPTPRWQSNFANLLHPPWLAVDHAIEVAIVVLLAIVATYAVAPSAAQELSPTVAAVGTSREVTPINELELAGIPHRHAAGEGAWMLLMAVGLTLAGRLQQDEARWRVLGLVVVAMAVCPLLAAGWEPQVAVASALRWFTAGALVLLSIPVWLRKVRNHREVRDLLVAIVALVYVLLAAYVGQAALVPQAFAPALRELWPWLALWALVAGTIALVIPYSTARQTGERSVDWALHARDVLLLLAAAPLAILLAFAVARSLDQRPLVGPEPGSWFRQIGFDVSYGVPLALIAAVLVGHAIRDRSSRFAFAAGWLFNVVATIVVLLRLARGGVLDASAWITVAQVNAVVSGVVAIVWLAAIQWYRRRWAVAKPQSLDARWPLLLVTQVALAAALCGTFLLPAGINLAIDTPPAGWAVAADGLLGWLAVALATVGAVLVNGRRGAGVTGVAIFAAALVALTALTIGRWDDGRWQAYHTLLVGACAAAWLVPLATRALNPVLGAPREAAVPMGWAAPAVRGFAIVAVLLAMFGYGRDPFAPWWTIGALAAIAARNVWIAWHEGRGGFVWIAALLFVPAVSILWLDWGQQFSATTGFGQVLEFLWINVLAVATMAVLSVWIERRRIVSASGDAQYTQVGIGFHRFAAWAIVATLMLTTGAGMIADLSNNPISVSLPLAWIALLAAAVVAGSCLWDARIRWPVACLYCVGLVAVGLYLDGLDLRAPMFHWALANALAAFSLATSGLWSMRERLLATFARLGVPVEENAKSQAARWHEGAGHGWLVPANLLIGVGVLLLVAWLELTLPSFTQRMVAAYAVGAQAFAIGLLARGAVRTPLQYLALVWGVFFAVAFGWAWLPPDYPAPWLHRLVLTVVTLAAVTIVYGFGLVKFLQRTTEWTTAAARLVPSLAVIAAALVLIVLGIEVRTFMRDGSVPIAWPALLAVGLTLLGLAIAALGAALLPGRDPLGLSERGRTMYVYAAEALAAVLFLHIRVTMPWLFHGWFQQFWPLVVMGIAFAGVGIGEFFQRRQQRVLAEPLETTGALLPLLPAIGFWAVASRVDYSLVLLSIGVLYAALAALRQSFWYGALAALAANGSLWYLLSQHDRLGLWEHPQLWLIPPALCALAAGYINRDRLTQQQSAALRYGAAIVIYVSSSAEVFIHGVSEAPWLPGVLAGLSLLGVLAGIMLRIRAFLYLGTAFLVVALMTVIWHAAAQHTWIWWIAGIITGSLILAVLGFFEKRRDDVLRVVEQLKHWQA
jgi:hypothetical protein